MIISYEFRFKWFISQIYSTGECGPTNVIYVPVEFGRKGFAIMFVLRVNVNYNNVPCDRANRENIIQA